MGKIIEKYDFVAEFERVIECNDGSLFTTRIKIKKYGNDFFPVWMHEINHYSDCNSQSVISDLVKYWESHLINAKSSSDFTINSQF